MSIPKRIDLKHDRRLVDKKVHLLPCQIHYSGDAPVSQYFVPQLLEGSNTDATLIVASEMEDEEADISVARASNRADRQTFEKEDVMEGYVRGHRILGRCLEFPPGYRGTIFATAAAITQRINDRPSRDVQEDKVANEEGEGEEELEEVSQWTAQATFSTLVEYGNNTVPDAKLPEWIALATAIHT